MKEKLKPCPFCGEIPQINCYNKRQVMHACYVLNKEIRCDIAAWNKRS